MKKISRELFDEEWREEGEKKLPCGPCATSVNKDVVTNRSEPVMYP